ncbi:hypothetical protein E2C01_046711 [Portunus trituberculatus]|uniref:Uncharacterized protein n=1 Tax=Portunus trituberculatus TaxID=210409 RepID=A0A5B7G1P8_PORTR|nr:hypothetical protein [Portunus trituberculatus]
MVVDVLEVRLEQHQFNTTTNVKQHPSKTAITKHSSNNSTVTVYNSLTQHQLNTVTSLTQQHSNTPVHYFNHQTQQ